MKPSKRPSSTNQDLQHDDESFEAKVTRYRKRGAGLPRVTFENGPRKLTGFFDVENESGENILLHTTHTYCFDLTPPHGPHAMSMTLDAKILTLSCFPVLTDKVYQIDEFMSKKECDEWVKFSDQHTFFKPPLLASAENLAGSSAIKGGEAWEPFEEFFPVINEDIAHKIWRRLQSFVPPSVEMIEPIGCSDLTKVYRCARDHASILSTQIVHLQTEDFDKDLNGAYILVFLQEDGLEGGEILINTDTCERKIAPKQGRLIFFRPGSDSQPFRSAQVLKGTRYVLFTEIMYSHVFKNSITPREQPNYYFYD